MDAPGTSRLAAGMGRRVPDLARRAVDRFTAEVPLYGLLPREELDGEILDITVQNLRLFLKMLREGRYPTDDELTPVVASAARRAEERVPLADVLAAYHIGARLGWLELVDVAEADEHEALAAAGVILLQYMQAVTGAISAVYLEVQQAIHGEERVARQQLAGALMAGQPTAVLAERAGVSVASSYVVLVLSLPSPDDDPKPEAGAAVARRRRVRQLQTELDSFSVGPVLGALDGRGGTALVPVPDGEARKLEAGLPELVDRLATATGMPMHAVAAGPVAPGRLPDEIDLARELVDLARRVGRPPGLYRLADLVVEHQLTRPGPAREVLAGRLDEIAEQPQLLETLRAYLDGDRRRRQAARELHIHPNTLDYRLGRIAELTGLDPAKQWDCLTLAAALAVRDALDPSGADHEDDVGISGRGQRGLT